MKLHELLEVLPYDQRIGIWDVDNKRASQPKPQSYTKVGNLPYRKIRNVVNYDVMGICIVEQNKGLLVRVYNKERLEKSLDHHDLARKIKKIGAL